MEGGAGGGIPGVGERERYVSLETYRAGGRPVRTPVCFVVSGGGVPYFVTRERTGKARRLAANPSVAVAACTIRGRVTGQWARGTAAPVSGGEAGEAMRLRRKKYGLFEALARLATRSKGDIAVYRLDFARGEGDGDGGGQEPEPQPTSA